MTARDTKVSGFPLQYHYRSNKAAPAAKKKCDAHVAGGELRTFTTTRLDDEDILSSHALLYFNPGLSALELVKEHLGLGYAEVVADSPR